MQVVFHLGVHGTDEGKVSACLSENADILRRHQIELSPNTINEPIINEALTALKGGTASPDLEEVIEDGLLDVDSTRRLILSRPNLLGPPRNLLEGGGILARGPQLVKALAGLVPTAQVEFFVSIKNPATMAPNVIRRMHSPTADFIASIDAQTLRWAPAIRRIREAIGPHRLVVWCNEDTPLIFPEVVRAIADLPADVVLEGDNAVAADLLSDEGIEALTQMTAGAQTIAARRGVTAAVLAEFHDPAALSSQIDLFGWDQYTVNALTEAYDADVAEIAALPGVEFIHP